MGTVLEYISKRWGNEMQTAVKVARGLLFVKSWNDQSCVTAMLYDHVQESMYGVSFPEDTISIVIHKVV